MARSIIFLGIKEIIPFIYDLFYAWDLFGCFRQPVFYITSASFELSFGLVYICLHACKRRTMLTSILIISIPPTCSPKFSDTDFIDENDMPLYKFVMSPSVTVSK